MLDRWYEFDMVDEEATREITARLADHSPPWTAYSGDAGRGHTCAALVDRDFNMVASADEREIEKLEEIAVAVNSGAV